MDGDAHGLGRSVAEAPIDWNDGRLITLGAGATARCDSLLQGELYAILFYNSATIDGNVAVTLVWSDLAPPVKLTVPGTTQGSGTASFAFLSGDDSRSVSVSLPSSSATAQIDVFIVSVSMPTNLEGLNDRELPADGELRPFEKLDRYHALPPTGWSSLVLKSPFTQFISLEMQRTAARIIVLNLGSGLAPGQPLKLGPTAARDGVVVVPEVTTQEFEDWVLGDGDRRVWMNGDSPQNSMDAVISLQQLSFLARLRIGVPRRLTRWFTRPRVPVPPFGT